MTNLRGTIADILSSGKMWGTLPLHEKLVRCGCGPKIVLVEDLATKSRKFEFVQYR